MTNNNSGMSGGSVQVIRRHELEIGNREIDTCDILTCNGVPFPNGIESYPIG